MLFCSDNRDISVLSKSKLSMTVLKKQKQKLLAQNQHSKETLSTLRDTQYSKELKDDLVIGLLFKSSCHSRQSVWA